MTDAQRHATEIAVSSILDDARTKIAADKMAYVSQATFDLMNAYANLSDDEPNCVARVINAMNAGLRIIWKQDKVA